MELLFKIGFRYEIHRPHVLIFLFLHLTRLFFNFMRFCGLRIRTTLALSVDLLLRALKLFLLLNFHGQNANDFEYLLLALPLFKDDSFPKAHKLVLVHRAIVIHIHPSQKLLKLLLK